MLAMQVILRLLGLMKGYTFAALFPFSWNEPFLGLLRFERIFASGLCQHCIDGRYQAGLSEGRHIA